MLLIKCVTKMPMFSVKKSVKLLFPLTFHFKYIKIQSDNHKKDSPGSAWLVSYCPIPLIQ